MDHDSVKNVSVGVSVNAKVNVQREELVGKLFCFPEIAPTSS